MPLSGPPGYADEAVAPGEAHGLLTEARERCLTRGASDSEQLDVLGKNLNHALFGHDYVVYWDEDVMTNAHAESVRHAQRRGMLVRSDRGLRHRRARGSFASFAARAAHFAAAHCSGSASLDGCDPEDFEGLQWAGVSLVGRAVAIVAIEVALRQRRRSRTTA